MVVIGTNPFAKKKQIIGERKVSEKRVNKDRH